LRATALYSRNPVQLCHRMEIANPDSSTKALQRCDTCNARLRPQRLSLIYMMHRLKEDVFGADRGLFLTIRHLFTRPQTVASAFIKGDDLRYYSPIKYFVLMLAVSFFIANDSPLDYSMALFISNKGLASREAATAFIANWNALLYLPMLLLIAVATRGFFRAAKLNYSEHLVIVAYGWSQMVLLSAIAHLLAFSLRWFGIRVGWTYMVSPVLAAYWLWYCGAVFSQKNPSGWLRASASITAAYISYIILPVIAVGLILLMRNLF